MGYINIRCVKDKMLENFIEFIKLSGVIMTSTIPTIIYVYFTKDDDGAWLGAFGYSIIKISHRLKKDEVK